MNIPDVDALLAEDRHEWGALVKVLEAHPAGTIHGSGENAWNSRDVYAHIARWLQYSNINMEKAFKGAALTEFNPDNVDGSRVDEINRQWKQEDGKLTLAEARQWAEKELARRFDLIKSMPAGFWEQGNLKLVSFDGAAHYRDHRHYITG